VGIAVAPHPASRLPFALLAYSVALAAFALVPPYLHAIVGPPAGFTLQEAADLLTPVVVIPLAWHAFDLAGGFRRPGAIAFLVIAAVWIEGQGIHLAANAIGDALPHDTLEDFYQTPPGELDHWLDESLSHWMWHLAWVALSGLFLLAGARGRTDTSGVGVAASAVAGFVHGVTFFLVTVEGVTTLLGIPASLTFLVWSGLASRGHRPARPVVVFFAVSSIVALVGYVAWAALNGWSLPEFSKVGLFG
jgi:hypothetical protein